MNSKSMIPKIIHLCWLSGDKYPQTIAKCIDSWKKFLPDYQIILWDEKKYKDEINNNFAQQAFKHRKWAFVADYIRLFALNKYGGIYLDSDVRVYKSFDTFLSHGVFSCIEYFKPTNYIAIEAAVIGAVPNHPFIKQCLEIYDNIPFVLPDNTLDQTTITQRIAQIAAENWGFEYKAKKQTLQSDIVIYPAVTFTNPSGEFSRSNTYAIHLCNGSWIDQKPSITLRLLKFIGRYWYRPHKMVANIYKKIKSKIQR